MKENNTDVQLKEITSARSRGSKSNRAEHHGGFVCVMVSNLTDLLSELLLRQAVSHVDAAQQAASRVVFRESGLWIKTFELHF